MTSPSLSVLSAIDKPRLRFSDLVKPPEVFDSIKTHADIQDAFSWVDRQHQVIETWKRVIYERYNQSLPIARLPGEILSRIFRYNIPTFPLKCRNPEDWYRSFPSWISVSHVCRAWRDIALADPHLWTFPYLNRPGLAKEMVARAGDLPLNIQVVNGKGVSSQIWLDTFALVFEKRKRIKAVDVTMMGDDLTALYHHLAMADTSPLETVSVTNVGWWRNDPGTTMILSPCLRTLRIRDAMPLIQTQTLPHLRSLYIDISAPETRLNYPVVTYTPNALLRFLAGAPQLEQIEIKHALGAEESQSINSEPSMGIVSMPRLASLIIKDSPDLTMELLRCLHMPSLWQLKLHNSSASLNYLGQPDLFTILEGIVSDSPCAPPNHLEVTWEPEKRYDSLLLCTAEGTLSPGPHIHIRIQTPLQGGAYSTFLSHTQEMFKLDHVVNGIRIWSERYRTSRRVHYASLPSITHLHIERPVAALQALLDGLRKPFTVTKGGVDEKQVRGVDFSRILLIQINEASVNGDFLQELGNVLYNRQRVKIELPRLRFNSCHVSGSGLMQLKGLLPGIEVEMI